MVRLCSAAKTAAVISTIGIDIGKTTFSNSSASMSVAIMLQRKVSRSRLERRLANVPRCLAGKERCSAAHHVGRQLERSPRATINQIRAFLIEHGLTVRTGAHALRNSLSAILEKRADELSPRMISIIQGLCDDWLHLDKRIEAITSEIEEISHKERNCRHLMSVPGIGPMISTAMVAAIGAGDAFERGRDFGAWLGLVPRQYSTGGKPILGRISKRGNKYLRTLFIQAANVILMRPQNWPKFSFGVWLANAATRMHRNKLATALANKLARIAWSVLPPSHEIRRSTGCCVTARRVRTRFATEITAWNGDNAHPESVIHNGRSSACPLTRPTVRAYSHRGHGPRADQQAGYILATSD